MYLKIAFFVAAFALSAAGFPHSNDAKACSTLGAKGLFPGITVNIAQYIESGTNFVGNTDESSYNIELIDLPAYCRLAAQFNTTSNNTVNIEIWLPPSDTWNFRFMAVGNGGWAGAINYPDISRGLRQKFATMSTNGGHNSSEGDGTFMQDSESTLDYGHRAMHLAVVNSKTIVAHYYSHSPSWSYYMGCSTGGRQGFAEVQLYGNDFDGALMGSPVIWQSHLEAWENYLAIGQFPDTLDTAISTTQWSVIHDEVLRQCDHLDGVVDGIISNPPSCSFVPEAIICTPSNTNASSCLTPSQIEALKKIYRGWYETNNTLVYPGIPPGSELTGVQLYTISGEGGYGLDFYRYAILNDSSLNPVDISYADVEIADEINTYGAITDAFSPDLSTFRRHGGKILHYHGWQDSIADAPISPYYYSKVLGFFASQGKEFPDPVSDFYRLFMVPGLGHCQGGDGAWVIGAANQDLPSAKNDTEHSALLALVEWTEGGKAPDMIIGTKYENETVNGDQLLDKTIQFTRPNCRWPVVPAFKGGDVNKAENWYCPNSSELPF